MKTRVLKNVGEIYSLALNIYVHLSHNIKIDLEYKFDNSNSWANPNLKNPCIQKDELWKKWQLL